MTTHLGDAPVGVRTHGSVPICVKRTKAVLRDEVERVTNV
jgi:hypothetical protein